MIFVTSDTHFDQEVAVINGWRPFTSVEHMNAEILGLWKNKVGKNDTIYVLGDFAWANRKRTEQLLAQLPGHKTLIRGNHDSRQVSGAKGWMDVRDYARVRYNDRRFILSHYPMLSWHGMHKGAIMLHGHCHGNLRSALVESVGAPIMDVGVDCWGFSPVSLDKIIEHVDTHTYPGPCVDHHVTGGAV